MKEWKELLSDVMRNGAKRSDRTGVGTLSLFAKSFTLDNSTLFPAVTLKKLYFSQVCAELTCFIRGFDNLKDFNLMGCNIWDANGNTPSWLSKARGEGYLGRIYGVQWRDWMSVDAKGKPQHTDQLVELIKSIKTSPYSRRHVVTAFNPGENSMVCLPPCHVLFQAYVRDDQGGRDRASLDICVYMRSVDLFLGLPFDIASYALLQRLIARCAGLNSGSLTFFLGDAHIYLNHLRQVETLLSRECLPLPSLWLSSETSLFGFLPEDAELVNYASHDSVKAPMNV